MKSGILLLFQSYIFSLNVKFKGLICYALRCMITSLAGLFPVVGLNAAETEKSCRKTSFCYFLMDAPAPGTAKPWNDARTVI